MFSKTFWVIGFFSCLAPQLYSSADTPASGQKEEPSEPKKNASGTFDVKIMPKTNADSAADGNFSNLILNKEYSGDLVGSAKGIMLAAGSVASGNGGYVAFERFEGTLDGRKGSFVLQHSGTLDKGQQHLEITVVPDSGTDELKGLSGTMSIEIKDGKHFYIFEYILP